MLRTETRPLTVEHNLLQKLGAEALGAALLLATVVGSGIMAAQLAGGNVALILLGNTLPTGAILFVLIVGFGPISGAHFNPVVTLAMVMRRQIAVSVALLFVTVQIAGAIGGVWAAHLMFDAEVFQIGVKVRTGPAQWFSEFVAAFGLVLVICLCAKRKLETIAGAVGLYITAAYWFTASTSFANPAVTIARGLTDSFAGIRPIDIAGFVLAQILGAVVATLVARFLNHD